MVCYLKKYFKMHIKCWYIYIPTIILMGLGLFVSLLTGKYITARIQNIQIVRVICSVIFGIISSILTVIPNYLFSKEICSKEIESKFIITMIFSQIFSVLFFILVGYVIYLI